ncbi:MAG: hypothetical protein HWD85_06690 [Flavobacteriaceae bacterium]|nr:hypothetical protein [Flavobacteriaceae bacterium]
MASIKNLKKDINYTLGDIIGVCDFIKTDTDKTEGADKVIDETIDVFDELMEKVHAKNVENKKVHFKSVRKELEEKATGLVAKINKL